MSPWTGGPRPRALASVRWNQLFQRALRIERLRPDDGVRSDPDLHGDRGSDADRANDFHGNRDDHSGLSGDVRGPQ